MKVIDPETDREVGEPWFIQDELVAVYLRTACKFGWGNEHECIKGAVQSVSPIGIYVQTRKFDDVFIPWANVAAVREIEEEDLKL